MDCALNFEQCETGGRVQERREGIRDGRRGLLGWWMEGNGRHCSWEL